MLATINCIFLITIMVGPLFLNSPRFLETVDLSPDVENIESNSLPQDSSKEKDPQKELKERLEIERLARIDQKVRAHELAHMAVGGQYAGAPSYSYVVGPDGKLYAVAGEVPIDLSDEPTPEETVAKMQRVIAAALAPADPSPQDYRVAAVAAQKLMKALQELAQKKLEELIGDKGENEKNSGNTYGVTNSNGEPQSGVKNNTSEDFTKLQLPKALKSYYKNSEEGRDCLLCLVRGET